MLKPQQNRSYKAIVRKDGKPILEKVFEAKNRRKAVHLAQWWFWYEYHGVLGPVHSAMIVTDPYAEVRYGPKFLCNDRMNKLLPEEVIVRLLLESNGELVRDERTGRRYCQPNSVRRKKRRRDFGVFIAPAIRKMKNGVLYYRISTEPQMSRNGILIKKRKYRDVRLKARTLIAAIDEIKFRGLHELNDTLAIRKMKVRDLIFTGHVGGLLTCSVLSDKQKDRFARILPRYALTA